MTPGPGLPRKVTGIYWTRWNPDVGLTQIPLSYNVLYLFNAGRSDGEEGGIEWGMNGIAADIATVRARGQHVVLSTGGAGEGIDFSSREVSTRFVTSVERINAELGGTLTDPMIDGVDFNTFEADATPNTSEYLWMFSELKRRFGEDFAITSPPAPWNDQDKAMIREALAEDLMTYAGPQFYDGPGLADPEYIVESTRDWVQDVAGGDAGKIVVGFGLGDEANYSSTQQILTAWQAIEEEFPAIRGVFLWQHRTDADRGWVIARHLSPLVLDTVVPQQPKPSTLPPRSAPTGPPVLALRIGSARHPLSGVDVVGGRDGLVLHTGSIPRTSGGGSSCEVIVTDGRVAQVIDRGVTDSTPATPVPEGGFVLAGHGGARTWLLDHAEVGADVEIVTADA